MGSATPGQGVLGCIRKQTEQAMGTSYMVPASLRVPVLAFLSDELDSNKPCLLQVALGQRAN